MLHPRRVIHSNRALATALGLLWLVVSGCRNTRQPDTSLFRATDFTAENLFSHNIEGPAFDAAGQLYVVNFQKDGTVGRLGPDGRGEVFISLPRPGIANAIQFNSKGHMLLADFAGHNVLQVNMATRQVSVLAHDERFNQPNDLCITRNDVLYASDPDWKNQTGQLWRIGPDGRTTLIANQMGTTNGICLSPDERTLYVNESVQRNVWAFALDRHGNLRNKRLFVHFDDFGLDGMKTDRQGNLFVTRYGKGTIAIFSPGGKLLREVQLRGKNVSNLVFGGPDGRTVYATLQDRRGMEQFRTEVPGR